MSAADTIKSLAMKIPGYRGYAERESRREADKELRDATSAAFTSQVSRITRVQEQMISEGNFDHVDLLDKLITRLQHLADRIRTTNYGFTGLFDEDKVDEAVLDRLYAFDLDIATGVEKIADLIAQMGLKESISERITDLRDKLDELHETFSQRSTLISNPLGSSDDLDDPSVEKPISPSSKP